ncbi:NAD(P)-dependent dehydrogenase, short-chain alcohol dehydrogenase family [Filimonas lacunae]|uniref:NAD(P)-dependent dehydrogenase, short-chain alcohol dehydrogenase family n=1 Tax=Filimonas lacunae TaxID=477680 RepID=A0A173MFS1_9BACT|nr:SDR family oxidoreductase [Filimonas lacunae]BAV06435.1 3-oxoacyl-[acyl-carrier protein] reductase [Filimonas lacunae]SIT26945.1 NAD(P)-dependent dehydrogenase, short-chain alcohol dehydrogenase family [Filimonas lacunae]
MDNLTNKVVVITGGNSGIGYAAAREFKSRGAKVVVTGKRQHAVDEAANKLGVTGLLADQADLNQLDKLVTDIKSSLGNVDVLFINAGVAFFESIVHTSEAQFDTMVNVNFKGSFFTLQKFLPILNDGASVIFLTSGNTALTMENSSVYSASKSAVSHLAKIAAKELARRNIRVNTVNPGPTETEMQGKFGMDEPTLKGMKEMVISQVPLGKMGVPEDVAKLVAYLADNAVSSFITGAEFFIDGGMAL